jgi:hypothetical protein
MTGNKFRLGAQHWVLAMALTMSGLLAACGQSPNSSENLAQGTYGETSLTPATKPAWGTGGTVLTSSSLSTTGVGSLVKVQSVSDYYYPNSGCYMKMSIKNYATEADVVVKEASFEAGYRSLVGGEQLVRIDMTVTSGTTLNDIDVAFGPSGLAFLPEATLTLKLAGPVTAEEVIAADHFGADGYYIESITTEVSMRGQSFLIVRVKVPGFSRYSLGGGN